MNADPKDDEDQEEVGSKGSNRPENKTQRGLVRDVVARQEERTHEDDPCGISREGRASDRDHTRDTDACLVRHALWTDRGHTRDTDACLVRHALCPDLAVPQQGCQVLHTSQRRAKFCPCRVCRPART